MAKRRGYSRDFTPASEKHGRYLLDKIPADLWRRSKQKAKREGISIRALLLGFLRQWLDGEASGNCSLCGEPMPHVCGGREGNKP